MPYRTLVSLEVETVETDRALQRLASEWRALWKACPDAMVFQSPEWLLPWWRHIGEGRLWTMAVRRGGDLVGLVPAYNYTRPGSAVREVFLLGIGTTDYLDALIAPGYEERVMEAAFEQLDTARHRWDVCDFQQLRPESAVARVPAPRTWQDETAPQEACPVLAIPPGARSLEDFVPPRMLHNLRYYTRRAEAEGEVRFQTADRDSWEEMYDALLSLHHARWETKGEDGVLAGEGVQRAHREAIPGLLKLGALRMYAMRLNGRIVAVYYGLAEPRGGRRAYYYLSGFDPALESLSLGTLMIGHALEEAVREGADAFDFLRGRESYKYLWGAEDTWPVRRRLWHPGAIVDEDGV